MNLDFDLSGLGGTNPSPKKDDDEDEKNTQELSEIKIEEAEKASDENKIEEDSQKFELDYNIETQIKDAPQNELDEKIEETNEVEQESPFSGMAFENELAEMEGENPNINIEINIEEISSESEDIKDQPIADDEHEHNEKSEEQEDMEDEDYEPVDFKVVLTSSENEDIKEQQTAEKEDKDKNCEQNDKITAALESPIIEGLKLNMPSEEKNSDNFENMNEGPELPPFVVALTNEEEKGKDETSQDSKKKIKKGLFGFFKKDNKKDNKKLKNETKTDDLQPQNTEIEIPIQTQIQEIQEETKVKENEKTTEPVAKKASGRFSIDDKPSKPKKEIPETPANFSTIKLELETNKKNNQEQPSEDILKKRGALFPQIGKEDMEKPVINILSEIAKTGINLDETIDQKIETEIFREIQKKKKSKLMLKKITASIATLVILGGVSAGIYFNKNNQLLASILKPVKSTLNTGGNESQEKDKKIEELNKQLEKAHLTPISSTGDMQKIKDLESQLSQKNKELEALKQDKSSEKIKEELDKLKEENNSFNKTLLEKNKTISRLMNGKDSNLGSGNGLSGEFLSQEELQSVKLSNIYDLYLDDYSLINKSNIPEKDKKSILSQFNNNIFDLKAKRVDYKTFRIKYNTIINKVLEEAK